MQEPIHHNSSHFAPISDALSLAQAKVIAALAQGQTSPPPPRMLASTAPPSTIGCGPNRLHAAPIAVKAGAPALLALLLAVVFLLVCSARPRVGGGSARRCVETAQMSGFFEALC